MVDAWLRHHLKSDRARPHCDSWGQSELSTTHGSLIISNSVQLSLALEAWIHFGSSLLAANI